MRKFLLLIFLLGFSILSLKLVFAQTTTDNCKDKGDPQLRADCYAAKIKDLQGQARTFSSQIAVMDSQINLTQARIEATEQQISSLTLDINTATKKVNNLESSLNDLIVKVLHRMVATYEVGQVQPFGILLSSTDATNFFSRLNYLKIVRDHDKQLIILTQQAKSDYTNQKNIFEDKKKRVTALKTQLESYTLQLNQQKQSKQDLLAQTQGDEAIFENLRRQALAQVAALSNFATSRFGGSLVPHKELSDGYGKYYNQRDTNWGNNLVGQSSETIAAVGCLLTSYSMVVTHYGGSISPAEVAANSGNFWFSTALFLKPGPDANGHGAQAVNSPSLDYLRDQVRNGHAVIAGLSYDGGPIADHWVVLRSTDGDTFKINDPLYDGAMDVSLNDHYNSLKIVEARIYQ